MSDDAKSWGEIYAAGKQVDAFITSQSFVEYTTAHLQKMMEISANVTDFRGGLPGVEAAKEKSK